VGVARGWSIQYNSKPAYVIDKRILVREGWKYLKHELQVPIYVAEEGRGWQTIIIKYEQHIFHRRGIRGTMKQLVVLSNLMENLSIIFIINMFIYFII